MRPRREVLLTTFADPSTFPSVFDTASIEEAVPSLKETVASLDVTVPALEEATPVPDETVPALDVTVPALEDTTPVPDETVPALDETVPPAGETVSSLDEATPAVVSFQQLGLAAELVRVLS